MKSTCLFYISLLFFTHVNCQPMLATNSKERVELYVCEYRHSKTNEKVRDYIELFFLGDSIIKGAYYGHTVEAYFVGDIEFRGPRSPVNLQFRIVNFKITKGEAYSPKNSIYLDSAKMPFELLRPIWFYGKNNKETLELNRSFWFYDSKTDKMIFKRQRR
jgi:hypothetical protein